MNSSLFTSITLELIFFSLLIKYLPLLLCYQVIAIPDEQCSVYHGKDHHPQCQGEQVDVSKLFLDIVPQRKTCQITNTVESIQYSHPGSSCLLCGDINNETFGGQEEHNTSTCHILQAFKQQILNLDG